MTAHTYLAALRHFDIPKDPYTRLHTPSLPLRMGIVHALNPLPTETGISQPWYIEDPMDYRAALCGARVKVVLPIPLTTKDPDGCWECQRILQTNPPPPEDAELWGYPTRRELDRRRQHFQQARLSRMIKNSEEAAQIAPFATHHGVCWSHSA
jgi:hypothetical protein